MQTPRAVRRLLYTAGRGDITLRVWEKTGGVGHAVAQSHAKSSIRVGLRYRLSYSTGEDRRRNSIARLAGKPFTVSSSP
jgi:hypothetical protein